MRRSAFIFMFIASLLASCVDQKVESLSMEFKSKEYTLHAGQKKDFYYELNINSKEEPVFSSSDENVATVTPQGVVVAVASGQTTITATLDGISASCIVKVTIDKVESINIKSVSKSFVEGFWSEVTAEILPAGYDLDNIKWTFDVKPESLEYEVKKVDACTYNIKVSQWVEGAEVTVAVSDTKSTTSRKKVFAVDKRPVIGAVALSLSPKTLSVPLGTPDVPLQVKTYPEDYHRGILSYSSSNEAVATVKDGVLSVVSIGSAQIRVVDQVSGLEDVCDITVTDAPAAAEEITSVVLSEVIVNKSLGDPAFQLVATCYNAGQQVPYYDLQWGIKSGGEHLLDVSELGIVTIKDVDAQSTGVGIVEVYDRKKPLQVRASCQVSVSAGDKKVTGLNVPSIKTLKEGESFEIEAVVDPVDAADKTLLYKSSDEGVASVTSNGVVTAVSVGETVITVMTSNGISAQCLIRVISSKVPVSKVNLDVANLNLAPGQTYTLTAVISPENASDKAITWESSNTSVAVVNAGKVEAKALGNAVITAIADGMKASCQLCVSDDVELLNELTEISVVKKQSRILAYNMTGQGSVSWRIKSGQEHISLDAETGLLVAKSVGEAVIEAVADQTVLKEWTVKVTPLYPTSISIQPNQSVVSQGAVRTLECVFEPSDCDYKEVVWKSSAPAVATVEGGLVSAHAVGTARITAESQGPSGKLLSTFAMVNVESPKHQIVLKLIDANVSVGGLKQEASTRIKPYYYGEDNTTPYSPTSVQWISSDESLAVVDQDGVVTNVAENLTSSGAKVTITHVADGRRQSIEIKLVRASAVGVRFTETPAGGVLYYEDVFTFKASVEPAKADQVVKWMGAPGKIDYDSGVYIANTIGYATVTAYAYEDGKNHIRQDYSFEVRYRDIESAVINYTSQTMKVRQSMLLSVDILPVKGTNKTIKWESSNPEVATVKDGKVLAVREGQTDIKATLSNGNILTCKINVEPSDQTFNIGDYYYSDGTVSSSLIPDKKLLGVVFMVDNVTLSDSYLEKDFPNCINGLVVCTEELTGAFGSFSYSQSNERGIANYLNACGLELSQEASNGYALTKAYGAYRDEYSELEYCGMFDKTAGLSATYAAAGYASESASSWFLPSFNDMKALYENKDVVNRALKAASADEILDHGYLQSTLWTARWDGRSYDDCTVRLFDMSNGQWGIFPLNTSERPVRLILAF